jgi:hypothetical protein
MSKIKVNTIAPRSGSTVTMGEAGDTIALGACASQTGFGRTGTVDWCTTAKTTPLTAVSGKGYFINTTGGAVTVTLPSSPTAGDIVALKDYAGTWATACKAVAVGRGGSKINGQCACATLNTASQSVTLIYVDGTKGWQDIHDSTSDVTGASFVAATGGTPSTSGDYKIHTFTGDGCFQVTNAGNPVGSNSVEYLVVAGGGGTGAFGSGGGGAGGFRFASPSLAPATYPAKPLAAPANLPVSATTYPITVGGGGASGAYPNSPNFSCATNGVNSVFSTITSAGGGRGGNECMPAAPTQAGQPGGSGGGGSRYPGTAGSGDDPPTSPPQGNDGGASANTSPYSGGGGGGALAVGGAGQCAGPKVGGVGGGLPSAFGTTGQPSGGYYYYAGGGGGGVSAPGGTAGAGGLGGGGAGKNGGSTAAGDAGTANMGGGGGGGGGSSPSTSTTGAGGAGGKGIVIVRYKFQ